MALTPTDNDAFFREVDENLRHDQMVGLARRWWLAAAAILIVGLAVLGFLLWWQAHRTAVAGREAETLAAVLDDSQIGRATANDPRLSALGNSSHDGYRALSAMTAAALASRTDRGDAAARYERIANDGDQPRPIRDLAMVRAVTLRFDGLPPQQVVDRLKPLAIAGGPWFGSAGELSAAAYLKMNRPDLAGPLLVSIARDATVPPTIRSRAATMAAALGRSVTPVASSAAPKE